MRLEEYIDVPAGSGVSSESLLRNSEIRYRRLFEAAQDGILIVDAETGAIKDANPFIVDLLGFTHGQLADKKLWEIGAFRDIFANVEKFRELQQIGYVRYEGLPLIAVDGRKLFVEFISNVYQESSSKVIQCNIRDNTERKRAELEKERLASSLAEKNKEIESFLYITTHDLRTPLVNIQGFSLNLGKDLVKLKALLDTVPMPEKLRADADRLMAERIPESMSFINSSAAKMEQLISALLKISRLGHLEIKAEKLNMDQVLETVAGSFAFQLDSLGGSVILEKLPACVADAGMISQFFSNLLDNAIKYRSPGRKLEIRVSGTRKDEHTVLYTVADNGQGIKNSELEKIWQVFFSGNARGPGVQKGEGIGLTIAKRMVEKSGGRIWVESHEGAGAKFYIELPSPE